MSSYFQYSIIRFRPFAETGEFANVGILALDLESGLLRHKLVPRRFRRVTQFFNALDPNVFSVSVSLLQSDLEHLANQMVTYRGREFLLENMLRRDPESVWTFSEMRTVRDGRDLDDIVDKLYELYVGRNFVNSDYHEQIMVREVRHSLKKRGIEGYAERVVEDEIVPVKFPLVSDVRGLRVIKPISLSQKTTIGVIDHAATWHDRLHLLLTRGRLDRDNILLPVSGPSSEDSAIREAYGVARGELERLGVRVIEREDEAGLVEFAKLGAKPISERWH